jgi:hypothetical protein
MKVSLRQHYECACACSTESPEIERMRRARFHVVVERFEQWFNHSKADEHHSGPLCTRSLLLLHATVIISRGKLCDLQCFLTTIKEHNKQTVLTWSVNLYDPVSPRLAYQIGGQKRSPGGDDMHNLSLETGGSEMLSNSGNSSGL